MQAASLQAFVENAITESFSVEQLVNAELGAELPTYLKYNRIFLVQKGAGDLIIDDSKFALAGMEIFLLAKGQVYLFEKTSVINGFMLCFGDCFWEKAPASASNCKAVLFNNASANQRLSVSESEMEQLKQLFSSLLQEYQRPDYTNQIDALAAYLKIIMIKIANVRTTSEDILDTQDYITYRKFMDLLSTKYRLYHEVADYAQMLAITPRKLSELCKRCTKQSAKTIINGHLLAEAKRSLQFSSSPVKEIAYDLSFCTPEQFSHFFKKNTNFSPADYRSRFVNLGA